MDTFWIIANVAYWVLIVYGMVLGFKVGKRFKASQNPELQKKGQLIQVLSIVLSWIGWIYALYLANKHKAEQSDTSTLMWVTMFIVVVSVLSFL